MMRRLALLLLLAGCDLEDETAVRVFGPAPAPATCLRIEEVLVTPTMGASSGWQWVNIHNRCAQAMPLAHVELRWTVVGEQWAAKMPLAPAKSLAAGDCLTVGGPKTGARNGHPDYDLAKQFTPALTDPSLLGTAAGVGLFIATSRLPFSAVIYGDENLEGIPGVGGSVDPDTDVGAASPGHSIRHQAGAWVEEADPAPGDCG